MTDLRLHLLSTYGGFVSVLNRARAKDSVGGCLYGEVFSCFPCALSGCPAQVNSAVSYWMVTRCITSSLFRKSAGISSIDFSAFCLKNIILKQKQTVEVFA